MREKDVFMKLPEDYIESVYAGWLGKIIGVNHGAPIEGWKADRIREKYGEVAGYVIKREKCAPDDDINGPIFFVRALDDYVHTEDITPEQMGLTLLNYVPFERGFFWWGGYAHATNHTAFLNLYNGVKPPWSGSAELNGITASEQLSGRIFVDTWGLISPCDYHRAARYAQKMLSVTCAGNGVFGGMFVAACVSAAFDDKDIYRVIQKGLSVIPQDCAFAAMVRDMIAFHSDNPGDFRAALAYALGKYTPDLYLGPVHIIPNSAIVVLSLLYGGGEFSKTVNICAMCGEDTDSNAGNVGSIAGVLAGLDGIDYETWRRSLNDFLATSSAVGSMNLRDIACDALFIADLGYKVAGEEMPEQYRPHMRDTGWYFGFGLPGSTHAFYSDLKDVQIDNEAGVSRTGTRSLHIRAGEVKGPAVKVYRQTYCRKDDLTESIYTPSMSPVVYPGQTLTSAVNPGRGCGARLFAYDLLSGRYFYGGAAEPDDTGWAELSLHIPGGNDALIEKIGVEFTAPEGGTLDAYIDFLEVSGSPDYVLDFEKSGMQYWTFSHKDVAQCSYYKGKWLVRGDAMHGSCADRGEIYTGGHDFTDYELSAWMTPVIGDNHFLLFRVQGAVRSYAAGFAANGRLSLMKNNNGYDQLASCGFAWKHGTDNKLTVRVQNNKIEIICNGETMIEYEDNENPYLRGAVGAAVFSGSRCDYRKLRVKGLR